MRALIELFLVILAVALGWNQPFRDHVASLFPRAGIEPSRLGKLSRIAGRAAVAAQAAAAATPAARDSSWMWGPTSLDRNAGKGGSRGR